MATRISYVSYVESNSFPEASPVVSKKEETIAYIKDNPCDILKKYIRDYCIVRYKGISIPYTYQNLNGKINIKNKGLQIVSISDAKSLPGFEVLKDEELFLRAKHIPLTKTKVKCLVERIKQSVLPTADPCLITPVYGEYKEIFDALGYKISIDELKELSVRHIIGHDSKL
ncbi:MAG: hypothetical protein WC755_05570 [Candidatus Woesearchaeota archaeon]|jgi:hypothetical protein